MRRHGVKQAMALQYAGFFKYSMQGPYLQVCNAGFLFLFLQCRVLQSISSSSSTASLASSPRSSSSRVRAWRSGSLEPPAREQWDGRP